MEVSAARVSAARRGVVVSALQPVSVNIFYHNMFVFYEYANGENTQ